MGFLRVTSFGIRSEGSIRFCDNGYIIWFQDLYIRFQYSICFQNDYIAFMTVISGFLAVTSQFMTIIFCFQCSSLICVLGTYLGPRYFDSAEMEMTSLYVYIPLYVFIMFMNLVDNSIIR